MPFARALGAMLKSSLGRDVAYDDGVSVTTIRGIFSNAWNRVEGPRGPGISSRRPELMVQQSDFTGLIPEPQQGHIVTIDEDIYEVVSSRPDEENVGFTLILKRL